MSGMREILGIDLCRDAPSRNELDFRMNSFRRK
jgi:hypothetical protein